MSRLIVYADATRPARIDYLRYGWNAPIKKVHFPASYGQPRASDNPWSPLANRRNCCRTGLVDQISRDLEKLVGVQLVSRRIVQADIVVGGVMRGAPRSGPSKHDGIDAGYIRKCGYYALQDRIIVHIENLPGDLAHYTLLALHEGTDLSCRSAAKPRHQFDMRRVAELVDRRHAFQSVAAIDQNSCVTRERRDVA